MSTRRIAGVLASASVLVGGVVVAAPASAAPVTRIVNTVSDFSCVFETAEGALVFFFGSSSSMDGESGAQLFVEDQDATVLVGEGGTASISTGSFAAEVPVNDVRGEEPVPVGVASIEGTRTVVGEPVTEEIRDRSGNGWTTGTVVETNYRVDLTSVSVPGYTVLPGDDDCTSQDLAFDVKTTNPSAQIYNDSDFQSAICTLEGLPNGEVRLTGDLREPFFEVVIDDGVNPQKASGRLPLRGGSGEATAPLIDLNSEEQVAQLSISVELTKIGRRQQESEAVDGITQRVTWVPYRASITVTTSDGRSGVADCYAEYVTEKIIIRPSANTGGH